MRTRRWKNWAGDQIAAPEVFEEPASEAELQDAVLRAAEAGQRIRPAGSGHSFSDIALSDERMVSLRRMDGLIEADRESLRARVQPGITLNELGPALAEHGLAMENLGDIDAQVVAGAVATGTHGTGIEFKNISAQVDAMRLVVGDGSVVEVDGSDAGLLRAARVSVGALGVISELTLRCVPLFTLVRTDEPRPLADVLEDWDGLAERNHHFEFFVFPYTDTALLRTCERTSDPPEPLSARDVWIKDVLLENAGLGAACRLGRARPSLIPRINRGIARSFGREVRKDYAYSVFANQRSVRFTEMEYSVPRAAGPEAVRRVLDLVKRRELPITFPLEVRVVAQDDSFLSPAGGRDCAYIAVHQFAGMEFETYMRAVEGIMRSLDGRPHWGKRHYRTAADLAPAYPGWDDFQQVRARLDPGGRFSNDFTDRVLGPVS
ncbi:MAG: FAD-binding protein [Thermoleophilaceae bacterium]|nr:FAD-binding protein [Thermoleophilaceae bacterium]